MVDAQRVCWLDEFAGWMDKEWEGEGEGCLVIALRKLLVKLEAWNRDTFGSIFYWKKRNLLKLEGMGRALERYVFGSSTKP